MNNNLWTPEVTQHGGHMIMENVKKPSKIKYLNIDSRFQEEYNLNKGASFTFQLPQKMTDIKSIAVRCAEIPMSFYYFSEKRGNTNFLVKKTNNGMNTYLKTIPDGNYTQSQLQGQISNALGNTDFATIPNANKTTITNISKDNNNNNYTIYWDRDSLGNLQRNNFKSSLGWSLGFRQTSYNVNYDTTSGNSITSEGVVDVYNIRYLFLVVDEFRSSNPNSFLSPLASSFVSKNILARITLNPAFFPYGTILVANTFNGYLLSDQRVYAGKTDIQKLQISLVDEYGNVVDLNGVDFSFCLEIEHE
jgi:hypothetical protein